MATIPKQILVDKPRVKVILWETLTETNADGEPYEFSGFYPDKCVQVIGSTIGTVKIQGSNKPTSPSFADLNDITLQPIAITSAGFTQILECPHSIRPYISTGTGVDVDVYLIMRKL